MYNNDKYWIAESVEKLIDWEGFLEDPDKYGDGRIFSDLDPYGEEDWRK